MENLFFKMIEWIEEQDANAGIGDLHWFKDGANMWLDTEEKGAIELPAEYRELITSNYIS